MSYLLWIIIAIVVIAILWFIGAYNGLVRLKNRVDEAWSDIDVQLKRRYDLIPNLIETVKGYASHEERVFTEVTEARTKAMQAQGQKAQAESENQLEGALKSLFAVAESYPQLKANENFAKLQDELTDTENKIQASRRFYNGNVRDFNTRIQMFPTNMIAGMLNFTKREFFEIANAEERENVHVSFNK